jgi:hypothetical protein
MTARVPLTLFTNVSSITAYAAWSDPLNPTDPWTGYPYQWQIVLSVQSQTHSDPYTPRPFSYNGLDVKVGDWLFFANLNIAVEIISITAQDDYNLTLIVEDVQLYNIINDPTQTGQGIGRISGDGNYNCIIAQLNSEGLPVFAQLPDYSVPVNFIADVTNRFQFRNYIQDFIYATQPGNSFNIGDIIWLSSDGNYHISTADASAKNTIGSVTSINQPNVGDFTYRPAGRYVTNLPTLPGLPGELLYVSNSTPGGLTDIPPEYPIPVYIKINDTSAILTSGSGAGTAILGNLKVIGNTITTVTPGANINITTTGNGTVNISNLTVGNLTDGRIALVGPNGQIIDSNLYTYNTNSQTITIGNILLNTEYIGTATPGVPLILAPNGANIQALSSIDAGGFRIVNVQDPIENQDAATKAYVDAVATGLTAKEAVVVATLVDLNATFNPGVSHGSLTGNVYQTLYIDDYYPQINERILVKNQGAPVENGIYEVVQTGGISQPWVIRRTADFNGVYPAGIVTTGDFVFVEKGTENQGTGWVMTTPAPVTVNISPINWTQFSSAGVIQAGFGLTKTGTILDVNVAAMINPNNGLTYSLNGGGYKIVDINLDPAAPLEFNNGAIRIASQIAGIGLNYSTVNGNLNVNSNLPTVTGLGNITSGTWQGNAVTYPYGGTGLTVLGNPGQVIAVNHTGDALQFNNASQIYETNVTPVSAYIVDGDRWYNTSTGYLYTRITDNTGSHWVEL